MIPYGEEAHRGFNQPGEFDPDEALKLFHNLNPSSCWIVGDWRASLLAGVLPIPFTKDLMCFSVFWYSAPNYKPGAEFVKLIFKFEEWAKINKAKYICMGRLNTEQEALGALYSKLGFEKANISHVKELQ